MLKTKNKVDFNSLSVELWLDILDPHDGGDGGLDVLFDPVPLLPRPHQLPDVAQLSHLGQLLHQALELRTSAGRRSLALQLGKFLWRAALILLRK